MRTRPRAGAGRQLRATALQKARVGGGELTAQRVGTSWAPRDPGRTCGTGGSRVQWDNRIALQKALRLGSRRPGLETHSPVPQSVILNNSFELSEPRAATSPSENGAGRTHCEG